MTIKSVTSARSDTTRSALPAAATGIEDDRWFDWLLGARHGGDASYAIALQPLLDDLRDRLLDNAQLSPGQTIVDIGSGDGFVGFAALERQSASTVTFVDVSPMLMGYARNLAERRGVAERCRFVIATAEALAAIPDESVDVVFMRAVLAYVGDKASALRECRRILRRRGRISIVDPINQDRAYAVAGMASQLRAIDGDPATRYLELLHRCRSAHYPDSLEAIRSDTLTNYNERDLLRLFELAGFVNIHLRLHIDSIPALPMPWPAFLASAPRAGVPTIGEILDARFTLAERREFERAFRPSIEAGTMTERNVNAYIFADAP